MSTNSMFLFILLLVVLSLSRHADFPQFPNKFYGVYLCNESYYGAAAGSLSTHEVIFDLENQRVYVSIDAPSNSIGSETAEFWLIFSPEGAQPGTPQANAYVIFASHNSASNDTYCSYSTTPDWPAGTLLPPGKFPPQWIGQDNKITLLNWFDFPADMAYAGSSVWRGVQVDVWNSEAVCSCFGRPALPCTRLATKKGTNIPAATSFSHQKRPASFETDWISFNWWTQFDTEDVPDIDLPETDWITKCYNSENGFRVIPERGFVSTVHGMDNFTLQLTSAPINSLGPVIIQFKPSRLSSPTVSFELEGGLDANGLTFDSSNWDTPVTVYIKYLSNGETYFNIEGTGGGYDIPHIMTSKQSQPATKTRSSSFRAVSCANGIPGYGC